MALDRIGTPDAPRQLFASTPAQRVALARQQFFEEGVRPSGLVGEAVIQSWMRCSRTHTDRQRIVSRRAACTPRSRAAASCSMRRVRSWRRWSTRSRAPTAA